ncbi:MAG: hypothetical protein J3K34DRAFT_428901 [Monoraphidium minutum]|nr:MAG: hypothetical protein J3K34DRAFT_428901 [Monoraphidium minutum]
MPALSRLMHGVRCLVSSHQLARATGRLPRAALARGTAGQRHTQQQHLPLLGLQQRCEGAAACVRCSSSDSSCSSAGASSGGSEGPSRGAAGQAGAGPPARRHAWRRRDIRCGVAADGDTAADGGAAASGGPSTIFTLPTILTLGRVAAVPVLIAAWFWQSPHATATVTWLFLGASLTDWLDGYLARKMNLSSKFGAFLDPVADKLMVAAALILLCTQPIAAGPMAGNAWLVPACTLAIIGREITMSALREWAATLGPDARGAVAVNAWGKWKTAAQMAALTMLLWTRGGAGNAALALGQPLQFAAAALGPPLLVVAAYLSAHSLALYLRGLWRFMV